MAVPRLQSQNLPKIAFPIDSEGRKREDSLPMKPLRWTFLLLAVTGALVAPATAAWAQTASVSAIDNEFDPAQLEASSGTTVTWTNNGDLPHTVTADNGSFESGNLDPGDTFEQSFSEAGEYSYFCDYHGASGGTGMSGTITVTGGGDPTNPPDNNGNGQPGNPDETTLPTTGAGTDIWAFVYLAFAFIGVGTVIVRLERQASL